MKFDYTHGKEAKYIVSLYSWNVSDHYYMSDLDVAEKVYEKIVKNCKKGDLVSIYDIKKDRKLRGVSI
jgi:hypothetical protein